MDNLSKYIIEKLQINKDTKVKYTEGQKIKRIIDKYLNNKVSSDEYKVYSSNQENELYIKVEFEKDQDNSNIHNWGLDIFNSIYDEKKYKKYNQGSDWWVSTPKRFIMRFEYK